MKHREKGQTLVESALVLLVFLSLILGTIDIGQLFYTRYMLTGQVRAVARRAAIEPLDDDAIRRLVFPENPSQVEVTRTARKLTIAVVNFQAPALTPWLGGLVSGSRPIVETFQVQPRP